jgi:carboxylesterase
MFGNKKTKKAEAPAAIEKRGPGLFCIHGFIESHDSSFKHLKEYLRAGGITNYEMPNVQGHGSDERLEDFDYKKAIDRIESQYRDFKSRNGEVYLLGFSMGGALAMHLAAKYGADKMVLVAPALRYGITSNTSKGLVWFFKDLLDKHVDDKVIEKDFSKIDLRTIVDKIMDFGEQNTYEIHQKMSRKFRILNPSTLTNFMRLINYVRQNLPERVDVPSRIFVSTGDEVVPIDSGYYALDRISNPDRQLVTLSKVSHGILNTQARKIVIPQILEFLYGKGAVSSEQAREAS